MFRSPTSLPSSQIAISATVSKVWPSRERRMSPARADGAAIGTREVRCSPAVSNTTWGSASTVSDVMVHLSVPSRRPVPLLERSRSEQRPASHRHGPRHSADCKSECSLARGDLLVPRYHQHLIGVRPDLLG